MRRILAALAVLGAAPALAEVPVFSCAIGPNVLRVTADAQSVSYAFGPPEAPELSLSNPLDGNGFMPWPGIGRTIFESIAFTNEGFSYVVYWSLDRLDPDSVLEGGVTISGGGDVETTLLCDPGSVDAPFFTLGDHFAQEGLCLDPETRRWGVCAN